MTDLTWRYQSRCADRKAVPDPEAMFPETPHGEHLAVLVCRGCPVVAECREDAVAASYPPTGVRGGLTELEVGRARRGRKARERTLSRSAGR